MWLVGGGLCLGVGGGGGLNRLRIGRFWFFRPGLLVLLQLLPETLVLLGEELVGPLGNLVLSKVRCFLSGEVLDIVQKRLNDVLDLSWLVLVCHGASSFSHLFRVGLW